MGFDLFILNSDYQRVDHIDEFSSLIWAERYDELGDFSLVVDPTVVNRARLYPGVFLRHSETDQPMVVDSVLLKKNEDGANVMTVAGTSFTSILDSRSISTHSYTGGLQWVNTGTIGESITLMVSKTCVTGTGLTVNDIIPTLYVEDLTGASTQYTISIAPQSLLNAVRELAKSADYGYRMRVISWGLPPAIKFEVYKGVERPNVVFSTALDNLAEESRLLDRSDYRNIAYVWGKDGSAFQMVPAPGVSVNVQGFARRVMTVDASDINAADAPNWTAYLQQLQQRGKEALAQSKYLRLFDGELTSFNPYKYNVDYKMGDIVTKSDEDGHSTKVRVTEYIWGYDQEGFRSFPTFTAIE